MDPSRLLLDTHIILWALDGVNLRERTHDIIGLADELVCSAASVWEISIKVKKGRMSLPSTWLSMIISNGVKLLDITSEHAYATASVDLPQGDPFDRLLVAQAMSEQLILLTADRILLNSHYPFIRQA